MNITLKAARLLMGMSQDECRKLINVSQSHFSKIENGILKKEDAQIEGVMQKAFDEWRARRIAHIKAEMELLNTINIVL